MDPGILWKRTVDWGAPEFAICPHVLVLLKVEKEDLLSEQVSGESHDTPGTRLRSLTRNLPSSHVNKYFSDHSSA